MIALDLFVSKFLCQRQKTGCKLVKQSGGICRAGVESLWFKRRKEEMRWKFEYFMTFLLFQV
jgi:hypothetical protein